MIRSDRANAAAVSLKDTLQLYCLQYGIAESRILELVGSNCARLDQIKDAPDLDLAALRQRARALDLELKLNSAATWMQRVAVSSGMEALFDADFRFVAVSSGGKTLTPPGGPAVQLPDFALVGHSYLDLLPDAISRCGRFVYGVPRKDWQRLAAGSIAGIQLQLELNFPFHHLSGVMEFWPVVTADKINLLHSVIHRDAKARPSGRTHGVFIERVTMV